MRSIPPKENLTIEFKSDRKKLPDSDMIDEVVGMSNTDGGIIYLVSKMTVRSPAFISSMQTKQASQHS